jgi:hypothetical protein
MASKTGTTMPRNPASSEHIAKRNAKIKKAADSGRFTQFDLAERFGLTQGAISQIVNNPLADAYLVRVAA